MAKLPASRMAVLNYEYGRSLGVTCFYDEAESYLLKAYELDQQSSGPAYMSLTELARMNLDRGHFIQAVNYYQKLLDEFPEEMQKKAPIGYADILDEYATAIGRTPRFVEAIDVRKLERKIREEHPEGYSITDRTPYGSQCVE